MEKSQFHSVLMVAALVSISVQSVAAISQNDELVRNRGAMDREDMPELTPLLFYISKDGADHWTLAHKDSIAEAEKLGYEKRRPEGFVYTTQGVGMIPLDSYYSSKHKDSRLCADEESCQAARDLGYTKVRTEGYILKNETDGAMPLKSYWNSRKQEHWTLASKAGLKAAENLGYELHKIEGYIATMEPIFSFVAGDGKDHWTAAETDQSSKSMSLAEKSDFVKRRTEGYIFSLAGPGMVPLYNYYSKKQGDVWGVAHADSIKAAEDAGYVKMGIEGYVFEHQAPETRPLKSYWSSKRGDAWTIADPASIKSADGLGYDLYRIEGYVAA